MERIEIGVVTKPQALKGAVRLKPTLSNLKLYKKIDTIFLGDAPYDVESVVLRDTFVILKLRGVDSCEDAEKLRGKVASADMELDTTESSMFVGFKVMLEGDTIGTIDNVSNYGAKDVISIVGSREMLLPLIDGLIEKVDSASKTIIFNKEIFEQVVVYED